MNIDSLKHNPSAQARLTYKLRNANVYVSREGFHFTDYLDPVEEIPVVINASQLSKEETSYIETEFLANLSKFRNQVDILANHLPLQNAKILDVGCGGGLFLSLLKQRGAHHLFGHKQIFSTREMKGLFESVGLEVIDLHKFHELSFPYEFYIRKLFRSQMLVNISLPLVQVFFRLFKIQNKMLVIGRMSA